ncbi:MAG: GntR family transcriptional regulator [Synergistaceae bacterium]|jgi:DNA-binding GntR family transcriptional regulator|nr:GntR family transcriptional regulator [Synergistaceae bacterium]
MCPEPEEGNEERIEAFPSRLLRLTANLSASEQAMRGIIQLLINHEYHPGDHLFETTLAERLKVSRTPIRTALTHLATCGFLEKTPDRKGYHVPILRLADMHLVFQTRALLEGALAAQAALNRDDAQIALLKEICAKEKNAFDELDKKVYAESNNLFHFSIAAFAKNPYLEQCLGQVFWRSRLYDFFFSGFYNSPMTQEQKKKKRSCSEHTVIALAIEAGDAAAAEKAMKEHLRHTYEEVRNNPRSDEPGRSEVQSDCF